MFYAEITDSNSYSFSVSSPNTYGVAYCTAPRPVLIRQVS